MKTRRRTFLKAAGAAAVSLATTHSLAAAEQRKVVLGFIGPGGMGMHHIKQLCKRTDVEIAHVCDVDQNRLANAAKEIESATKRAPKTVKDMREVFDDRKVEAVFIATPDHWHVPASILALDAGKHVYVEKPVSHNIREGRLLADAVKRSGKCLQIGTQSRSTATVIEGLDHLKKGDIGEVLAVKAWNSQLRRNIGKSKPGKPPAYLDFDLWLGPVPEIAYRSNMLPGIWRWWKEFGCGDIGNDGVHDIDVALWGMGVTTHPNRVTCLGGKYFFDDDQHWPDTQYAIFEYDMGGGKKKMLTYEQRIWSPYVQEGYENGAAFYGTKGMLIIGHSEGWKLYGPRNKLIAEKAGKVTLPVHHTNFLDCVRGEQKVLNADVLSGHLAATICHLSNIAMTAGRTLTFDPKTETFPEYREANAMVKRQYREGHWATPKGV